MARAHSFSEEPYTKADIGERERSEVRKRFDRWQFLAWVWGAYYIAVFTLGRYDQYTQGTIWIGGGLVGCLTLWALGLRFYAIPREALFLVGFLGWALLGSAVASDLTQYTTYFRYSLQLLMLVALLGTMIRLSGAVNALWWSFLIVAVFNTVYIALSGLVQIAGEVGTVEREAGLTGNANALGFSSFLGFLGALILFGEKTSLRGWLVCIAGGAAAFWGMLAAGSRGAYVAFVLAVALWPIMCVGSRTRRKWIPIAVAIVSGILLYTAIVWIQANTNLGQRMERAYTREDTSSESRLAIILAGLHLTARNPLIGVGLGQFQLASGTGKYAHNEWIELAATTGLPGFLLFMGVYWSAWRRLGRTLKVLKDPIARYRIKTGRMTLIILVISGALFRPNFLSIDTMFVIALVVGLGNWGEEQCKGSDGATAMPANRLPMFPFSSNWVRVRDRIGAGPAKDQRPS